MAKKDREQSDIKAMVDALGLAVCANQVLIEEAHEKLDRMHQEQRFMRDHIDQVNEVVDRLEKLLADRYPQCCPYVDECKEPREEPDALSIWLSE